MLTTQLNTLFFRYKFSFNDKTIKSMEIIVSKDDLSIVEPKPKFFPEWAKLKEFKCPHCPLDVNKNEFCPLALNLQDILKEFGTRQSFETVEVFVETPHRNYYKLTSLQQGVSSLLGILMVTSGCPVLGKLKPLLYFHLPFASVNETEVRALSLYLLSQYIKSLRGEEPDWEMKKLQKLYDDIRILNYHVSQKIVTLIEKDASINSLIILNNFAEFVTIILSEKALKEVEFYLKEFLNL